MLGRSMLTLALLVPTLASAQEPGPTFVPREEGKALLEEAEKAAKGEAPPDGWTMTLKVGVNFSLSDSRAVPGIEDGTTYQIGGTVKGNAKLISGPHEWRNSLDITHTRTSAPPLDQFIKSADDATLKSMYLYALPGIDWLGPFARFRLSTALAPGELLMAGPTDIEIDGVAEPEPLAGETALPLTSAFEPMLIRESLGAFAQPLKGKTINMVTSLGVGAQQIITRGGQIVSEIVPVENREVTDPNDPPIRPLARITTLNDSTQVGLEVEVAAEGQLTESLVYGVIANVLMPFYSDPETSKSATGEELEGIIELTNVDIGGHLGVKLAKWASLDYVLSAKYLPLVVPEWQLTNSLLLNASFNLL